MRLFTSAILGCLLMSLATSCGSSAAIPQMEDFNAVLKKVGNTTTYQMLIATGCDEGAIDTDCLRAIAKELDIKNILYGSVSREPPGRRGQLKVDLAFYQDDKRRIVSTVTDRIAENKKSLEELRGPVDDWVGVLSGTPKRTTLIVKTQAPSAVVLIDDKIVGKTDVTGELTRFDLPAGTARIEVRVSGQAPMTQVATIRSHRRTVVDFSPTKSPHAAAIPVAVAQPQTDKAANPIFEPPPTDAAETHPTDLRWLGYTAFGVSAAMFGMMAYSMVRINSINNDPTLTAYRNSAPSTVTNVCTEAQAGMTFNSTTTPEDLATVQSLCKQGNTYQVLQWVFLGAGVASAGLGTYIFLSHSSDDGASKKGTHPPSADATTLQLQPRLGYGHLGFDALLRF